MTETMDNDELVRRYFASIRVPTLPGGADRLAWIISACKKVPGTAWVYYHGAGWRNYGDISCWHNQQGNSSSYNVRVVQDYLTRRDGVAGGAPIPDFQRKLPVPAERRIGKS